VTNIDIAVAVIELTLSMEFVILEFSLINFALECVDTSAVLFVVDEIALIDCAVCFSQFTLAVFLSSSKLTFIVGVFFDVF